VKRGKVSFDGSTAKGTTPFLRDEWKQNATIAREDAAQKKTTGKENRHRFSRKTAFTITGIRRGKRRDVGGPPKLGEGRGDTSRTLGLAASRGATLGRKGRFGEVGSSSIGLRVTKNCQQGEGGLGSKLGHGEGWNSSKKLHPYSSNAGRRRRRGRASHAEEKDYQSRGVTCIFYGEVLTKKKPLKREIRKKRYGETDQTNRFKRRKKSWGGKGNSSIGIRERQRVVKEEAAKCMTLYGLRKKSTNGRVRFKGKGPVKH